MKRLIVPFALSLGLSLGITTGIAYARRPAPVVKSAVKPDSAKKDSANVAARKDSAALAPQDSAVSHDSAAAPGAPAHAAPPSHETHETKGPITVPVKPDPAPAPAPTVAKSSAKAPREVRRPTPDSAVEKRLAKVFAAMQPRDAARVLTQMDDGDVQTILASLNGKQQAAILGNFPAPRAAKLAQSQLHGSGEL